ncbi:MAG: FecR domain-containing protein [Proteobacteria bacterium]|nr:FecR domain-containing protein [Pseudomonadota bacterium]MDA1302253.1 FecR domain-containing protein [Pseudomonadota bacterium]
MTPSPAYHSEVIRTEACAWFAQLESGNLDTADIEALREWLARSPRHVRELKRIARVSADLNILTSLAQPLQQAASSWRPIVRGPHQRRWPWAFAALAVIATVLFMLRWSPDAQLNQSLVTAIGQYEEYVMPDGSVIALNTGSKVDVNFTPARREVSLLSGEALFTVAKDRDRPFVVTIGHRRVEAVGTAFVVRRSQNEVEVAVTEGEVLLSTSEPEGSSFSALSQSPGRTAAPRPVLLGQGQSLRMPIALVGDTVEIRSMSESELRRKLAWREGLLDFERTPLHQVVVEVNRHTGRNIVIQDAALKAMKFDGLFRVGETEKLLQALAIRSDIDVQYLEGDTVLLSQRASEPK